MDKAQTTKTPEPFATKVAAEAVAATRHCAGPVWVWGAAAAFHGVRGGWYVGFPPNISKALIGAGQ